MYTSPVPAPRRSRPWIAVVAVVAAVVVLAVAALAVRAVLNGRGDRQSGARAGVTLLADPSAAALAELEGDKHGATGGAVVAVDPTTGAVLVAVSTPHSAAGPADGLDTRGRALANGAFTKREPPGAVFHVVVAAMALAGGQTPQTRVQAGERYAPPGSQFSIRNPTAECADLVTLQEAVVRSCHTAFARLCVEQGASTLTTTARSFGFGPPEAMFLDGSRLEAAASTTGPLESIDRIALAQTCVGQRDVRMTPLLGGLMAGAAVNGGRLLRPYVTRGEETRELGRPLDGPAADGLRAMMVASVADGDAKNARIPGVEVGGKAGGGTEPDESAWFIGFASRDGKPVVAVAVLLQDAGAGGGAEAARVGGQVMRSIVTTR